MYLFYLPPYKIQKEHVTIGSFITVVQLFLTFAGQLNVSIFHTHCLPRVSSVRKQELETLTGFVFYMDW